MYRAGGPVKTRDLLRTLEKLGFVASSPKGIHTVFRHADGAVVTIPTGRKEVPAVFLNAVIGQATARNLATSDEFLRLLNAKPASEKAGLSA